MTSSSSTNRVIYGTYHPDPIKHVLRCNMPRVVEPMACKGGGLADAIYRYVGKHKDKQHSIYRLESVQEWMPPKHPSLNPYDNNARLPMMRNDGTLDIEAEAAMRRREWAQMGTVAEDVFEDDDEWVDGDGD
jgi:hypothetical protein